MREELSRVSRPLSASGVHSLMMGPLPSSSGGMTMLHHSCRRYLALIIFARYDGPFYTNEAVSLDQIATKRPDIAVFGLMAYETPEGVREFVRQEGISYPVLNDTDGSTLRNLDLPRTPWDVVFDCARRTLVYEGPSAANGFGGESKFVARLLSLPR